MIHSYEIFEKEFKVGMRVYVMIAHVFEYGYWKSYTPTLYNIVGRTEKTTELVNSMHSTEHLILNKEMFDSGFIKINN